MKIMATQTRERMIEATARLLLRRGYHGTSLNDILKESGAPRGSLYFHFPGGKEQLVLEATRRSVDQTTQEIAAILDAAETPARGIRSILEETARLMDESDFAFGCPIAPLVLDSPAEHPQLVELCRSAFEEWVALIRTHFVSAGIDESRAHNLALLVESALEGLLLMSRALATSEPHEAVAAELERVIDAATPSPAAAGDMTRPESSAAK
jgi:TetR/AcrR family transcriptional regulator, lmrAB and yxaGH operons repressor